MAGDILENAHLKEGDALIVELEDYELIGRVGLRKILHFKNPSDEILKAVTGCLGVAKGRIERVYRIARVAEVGPCYFRDIAGRPSTSVGLQAAGFSSTVFRSTGRLWGFHRPPNLCPGIQVSTGTIDLQAAKKLPFRKL